MEVYTTNTGVKLMDSNSYKDLFLTLQIYPILMLSPCSSFPNIPHDARWYSESWKKYCVGLLWGHILNCYTSINYTGINIRFKGN